MITYIPTSFSKNAIKRIAYPFPMATPFTASFNSAKRLIDKTEINLLLN